MGQRLVISVRKNNERVAAFYFHWSAYSISALNEARDIINYLLDDENQDMDIRLACIRYAEQNGGGITGGQPYGEELKYVQSIFPDEEFKTEGISRNCGLVAISENEMESFDKWSEGDITIDLDNGIVTNYVYFGYNSLDEYNEERKEWDEDFAGLTDEDVFHDENYDLGQFRFEDIDDIIDIAEEIEQGNNIWLADGYYYSLIC